MNSVIREFIRKNGPIDNPSALNGCESNRPKTAKKERVRYYHNASTKELSVKDNKAYNDRRLEARKVQAANSKMKFERRLTVLLG